MLDEPDRAAFVEAVAAEAGRLPALLAGRAARTRWSSTPRRPGSSCCRSAASWRPRAPARPGSTPAPHALATAYQVAWLVDADPFVLLALRGLPREDLLARLHDREERGPTVPDDVALAVDAATRATRILQLLDAGELDVEHLL